MKTFFIIMLACLQFACAGSDGDSPSTNIDASCDVPPEKFLTYWTGTFTCTNTGTADQSDTTSISITIDGTSASFTELYDPLGSSMNTYQGSVCGNTLTFSGGPLSLISQQPIEYTKSGVFVLTSPTTATRSSDWKSLDSPTTIFGHCEATYIPL